MEWWRDLKPVPQYPITPVLQLSLRRFAMAMPNVGQNAPEFTLPVSREQNISLKDYQGKKNVVLAFYPLDFTGG